MDDLEMVKVRQSFPTDRVRDVSAEVKRQFEAVGAASRLRPGSRVAITAGSRGIAEIVAILRAVVSEVRSLGAHPFLVPAMGSHGGATAEGQREVLRGYGIAEDSIGAPVMASMETVHLGTTAGGARVFMDRHAHNADHTIVVNRIKAHTAFRGSIESGLCKMIAVGLGKKNGADAMHDHSLAASIPEAAEIVLAQANVVFGIGIVENAAEQPYRLVATPPEKFHETDRELLLVANSLLPRIPFDTLDVLIIDWMGKNLSGVGIDYNIVGMWRRLGGEQRPFFRYVVVLDLTPESEGNAIGVGIADFTTRRLVDKIDYQATYTNVLTSGAIQAGKIPVTLQSDREAIAAAYRLARRDKAGASPRVVRVHSTLHLGELYASANLLPEIESNPYLSVIGWPAPLPFDVAGNLSR